VEDTGPGIAPAERATCSSVSTASSATSTGSGLGLAIVREIAQQHGAEVESSTIRAPPSPSCRAPFRVTFAAAAPPREEESPIMDKPRLPRPGNTGTARAA
jgi:two-component system sensor histidine kinase TctE